MASIPTYQLELQMLKHQMTKGGGGPQALDGFVYEKGILLSIMICIVINSKKPILINFKSFAITSGLPLNS